MATFKELVADYDKHLSNVIALEARFPNFRFLEDRILAEKAEKHSSNYRQLAIYLAGYLGYRKVMKDSFQALMRAIPAYKEAFDNKKLSLAGKTGIEMVGYLHEDGTYHWFKNEALEESL